MIVLASASAARRRILEDAGVAFNVDPADVDEAALKTPEARLDPAELSVTLAAAKARDVSRRRPGDWVIGSDQILAFDGRLVSKARSLDEARARLSEMRGREHLLWSGVALARGGEVIWSDREPARMTMRGFSDAFLDAYLTAEGEGLLASVGCYRIEGRGAQLFARVDGAQATIMGMPLWPLLEALRSHGALPA
ncbi:MAG: septum formation protein Maf [Alphaproteobacteria bacterium]|nr:septum formation protein Maf [Alphaproteobacteria bacterium]MBU1527203.1 septum formation protein Maf [Alphaproteobacteria bacterium]MBU2118477.1 septum formation protein Maf [Alphaproteobacteria bacterium]MBU2351147.1 septum formation protein Maf [Alphaproteobacteria bacterium]MBU2382354.1 septum formation protein Maf [Alphaproteobacteria bacterium]